MRLFLGGIFSFFVCMVIFSPLWMYLMLIVWLIIDYFVLMGGTLNWMNRKVDKEFKGTSFLRRILATDARILLSTTTITIMILVSDYFHTNSDYMSSQWSGAPFAHSIYMFDNFMFYTKLAINQVPNDITYSITHHYIFVVILRGLLVANLIHVIHHLLVNQHLAGVRFTKYPPLMRVVYRCVTWARR